MGDSSWSVSAHDHPAAAGFGPQLGGVGWPSRGPDGATLPQTLQPFEHQGPA